MLENIDLFGGLSTKDLEEIEKISRKEVYKRGEVIFSQGDFADDFFIIESGQVEVAVKDLLENSRTLTTLKNGDFFGELALFDKGTVRSATTRAVQNSTLIVIPGESFERLLKEKPTISFKLLGVLSKRLKESNSKAIMTTTAGKRKDSMVLLVAAAKNGFGKTTFATSLARMLSHELPRKVLYIDLDLYFAEGTFILGVVSPKNICDLARAIVGGIPDKENFFKYVVKHSDNFYSLPSPNNLLDGDRLTGGDFVNVLKACKQHFEYIVVDSDSNLSDVFLNALDMADHTFFLVDTTELLLLKGSTRYFQGLSKLNYPEEKMTILASKVSEDFNPEKAGKLLKFKLKGGIPKVANYFQEFGKTLMESSGTSTFMNVLRLIAKTILKEPISEKKEKKDLEKNIFFRLFYDSEDLGKNDSFYSYISENPKPNQSELQIPEENFSVLLKYVRLNIIYGNVDEAREQIIRLVEFSQHSSCLYELLGEVCLVEKNFSQAIDALKKAFELDSSNHLAMGYLSSLTSDQPMFQKALELLKQKISEHPKYPDLQNDLGKLLYEGGNTDEALAAFQKSLEINPNFIESRLNLAVVFGKKKNYKEAIRILLETHPKNIRVFYLLGKFFFATGNFFEALTSFSNAAEINGSYQDVGHRLSQIRDYFRRLNDLLELNRKLLNDHPKYPDLHFRVGNLLGLLGKKKEAVAELQAALKLNPNYERAKVTLEKIQSSPDYELSFNATLGEQKQSGHRSQTNKMQIELEFDPEVFDIGPDVFNKPFAVRVRNIRTGKNTVIEADPALVKENRLSLDCSGVGIIASFDMLMIKVSDPSSVTVFSALPHSISETEILEEKASVRISPAFKKINVDDKGPPIKYFYLSLRSPALSGTIDGNGDSFKAFLVNPRIGASCKGFPNPEDAEEINFVLSSPNGKNVVEENDLLKVKIVDQAQTEILSLDVSITQENIQAFSKYVTLA